MSVDALSVFLSKSPTSLGYQTKKKWYVNFYRKIFVNIFLGVGGSLKKRDYLLCE